MKMGMWLLVSMFLGVSVAQAELLPAAKLALTGPLTLEAGNSCAVAKINNAGLYQQAGAYYLVIESQNYSPKERHVYRGTLVVKESYCSRSYFFEGSEDSTQRRVKLNSVFPLARIAIGGGPVCALPAGPNTSVVESYMNQATPTPVPIPLPMLMANESGSQPGNPGVENPGWLEVRSSGVLRELR